MYAHVDKKDGVGYQEKETQMEEDKEESIEKIPSHGS